MSIPYSGFSGSDAMLVVSSSILTERFEEQSKKGNDLSQASCGGSSAVA
jgi:hypothetical protein